MRILLASSEVYPYSKTGGLGDAVGALGKALAAAGHRVGIITPLYRGIREQLIGLRRVDWEFDIPLGSKRIGADLLALDVSDRLTIYFIDKPIYFDRAGIYNENGADYSDNAERFIFLSKCVAHLAHHLPLMPEVLHLHDWPVGIAALMVQHEAKTSLWENRPRICFTIHNLAYQGVFPADTFSLLNLPLGWHNPDTTEFYGKINCLKAGIACADVVTTVSPRYAREITTQEYGAGLDGLLRKRQNVLNGILNGVDYEEWNTTSNPHLATAFSADNVAGKVVCKSALQQYFGLPIDPDAPIFGSVTRLADQKGIDLLIGALDEVLDAKMQFVLLGSGNRNYEQALNELSAKYASKVGVKIGYDHGLAHQIEAGCDFFIMPSRFEPCGLNQLYSLRYGTVPIVRRTGGLDDTVIDAVDGGIAANGIKFNDPTTAGLVKAIHKALTLYDKKELLNGYRANGFAADFSWAKAVAGYELAYRW
ncbi:MAG: glycogen synthase GlgA [Verrucomicrobia bacterium]|jgi:starch synthase|nr:MAG: glycogen synthase GlgA [Verrucomicrobiota bacterium]